MSAETVATMLLNNPAFFGRPIEIDQSEMDEALAQFKLRRTVRIILDAECSDGSCIDNPAELRRDIIAIMHELDDNLVRQAHLVAMICTTLIADRAAECL